jgi:hypothetical protein
LAVLLVTETTEQSQAQKAREFLQPPVLFTARVVAEVVALSLT